MSPTVAALLNAAGAGSSWATTIGAVCDQHGGEIQTGPFGSQLHASDYADEGTPVVMPQDMQGGSIVCDRIARVADKHVARLPQHVLVRGDVVFSRRGDVTRFAIVTEREAGWLCGTGSIRIRLNCPDIDIAYARQYLQQVSVGDWLKHNAKGVTMANLNTGIIRALPFVYPPLDEQRRIAEVLDRAEALLAKRRTALAQLDTLTQSIFLDLFGDPSENRWDTVPISEYVAQFEGGKSLEADAGDMQTRHRVLKISAVTGMKYRPEESKPLPDSYHPPIEHFVKPGDLLFSRANTPELVGAVAYVDETPANVLLPDKLWRFVWRKPIKVEPLFVWALFQTPAIRQEIQRRATGTSGSMKNISQEKLYGIRTLLPPLAIQQEFVRRSAAVESLKSTQCRSLTELDTLFASLQHRAFRGEL